MKKPSLCFHKLSSRTLSRVLMKEGAPEGPAGSPRDVLDTFYKENGVLSGQEAWDYIQTEEERTSADRKARLEALNQEVNIPKDVFEFMTQNRRYLEGAIGVAVAQLHDAYHKKFPGDSGKAIRYFHSTTTFFADPKVQEMFRLYKNTDANGKKYIETFAYYTPGITSDTYGLVFAAETEWGRTDGSILNWPK